ncbi:MAG: hypothetical protein QM516_01340 [Limnohabitans sp.]|nr:hypothetical protein [Limnohabitans sp.]
MSNGVLPLLLATCNAWMACALVACSTTVPRSQSIATADPVASNDVRAIRPLDGARGSLVAVVFISHECPIANAMVPALRELAASAAQRAVTFHLVHSSMWVTAEEVTRHAQEFTLSPDVSVLVDPTHVLVRRAGATVTPEAALFRRDGDGGGDLIYRGRVNDLYVAIGRRRSNVASHDLRNAMDAAISGRPIATPFPSAVGCFIEEGPRSTEGLP